MAFAFGNICGLGVGECVVLRKPGETAPVTQRKIKQGDNQFRELNTRNDKETVSTSNKMNSKNILTWIVLTDVTL